MRVLKVTFEKKSNVNWTSVYQFSILWNVSVLLFALYQILCKEKDMSATHAICLSLVCVLLVPLLTLMSSTRVTASFDKKDQADE